MLQGFKNVCRAGLRIQVQFKAQVQYKYSTSEGASLKDEWRKRRNVIFDNELTKQKTALGRIEKITVKYLPTDPDDKEVELCMNKDSSTPSDVAQHLSKDVYKTSALALVDGVPWDMQKPLSQDCSLKLLSMTMPKDSGILNTTFWRTCSLILGSMIESAFKDEIQLYLHSFPRPNVRSGSFVYDVILDLPDWKPTDAELRAMSAQFVKITNDELPVERLEVTTEVALDMFQDNPFKTKQIPDITKSSESNTITLYRIGDHIDISRGPMVGNTNIVGRATVAAVHKIESPESDRMYRFQGIAIPRGIFLNHFAFGILENRARKLNETLWIPQKMELGRVETVDGSEEKSSVAANN